MRLLFLGSGAFGLPTLRRLASRHTVVAVVSQPDRPSGRGGRLTPTPIAEWTQANLPDIPLLKPERINEPQMLATVRQLGAAADAWVVIAFGQKLSAPLLDGVFAVNLHASRLPRWRGAAPINAAVLAGDAETGNSVITLADRMDAGLVLGLSRRPILPDQTAGDLHDLLAEDGPDLVEDVLARHASGTLTGEAQDESLVTVAPKLGAQDRWLDLTRPAAECRNRIHGLSPWPSIRAEIVGSGAGPSERPVQLKLLRATVESGSQVSESGGGAGPTAPGALTDPARGIVACGRGGEERLRLVEVQPDGKRPMPWADFARGANLPHDAHVRSLTPPPTTIRTPPRAP